MHVISTFKVKRLSEGTKGDGWLVAHLLATAVRMQTSLKNTTWATKAKEWPTHSSLPKKYTKKKRSKDCQNTRKNGISPKLVLNVAGVRNLRRYKAAGILRLYNKLVTLRLVWVLDNVTGLRDAANKGMLRFLVL